MDMVGAYVRVSTEKQREDGSHHNQRETIENWIESNLDDNVEIRWFEDIAESGQNLDRDAYEDMMEKVDELDAVVVRELSRFGRSLQKVLNDVEKMKENNCDFISVKDADIDTSTAQGQLLFNVIASFNQFWADLASERTQEMIQRRKDEGKPIGRPKKLSNEQIEYLHQLKAEQDVSYTTLTAIAEEKWNKSVTRQTMARYMRNYNGDEP